MPDNQWYYAQNYQQLGPVTLEALIDMVRRGNVQPTDLVWTESMSEWRAASTVPALMPAAQVATDFTAVVPQIADASINYYSSTGLDPNVAYAGFWMRFGAVFIDGILLAVLSHVVGFMAGVDPLFYPGAARTLPGLFWGWEGIQILMPWLYFAMMESSKNQATLGKMALGIIVIDTHGQRISFGRATGRFFAKYVSYITLFIGFMMAGWTQRKQALHDMMANTLVIRKPL